MSSRRPQSYRRRVDPLRRLRHSVAAELSRPSLQPADVRPVTVLISQGSVIEVGYIHLESTAGRA